MVCASMLFNLSQAKALESQSENDRLDTLKSLTINRSMLARFESQYMSLVQAENLSTSDRKKRELMGVQYKIKALGEDNEKLMNALPEKIQADEFLKNVLVKTQAENISRNAIPQAKVQTAQAQARVQPWVKAPPQQNEATFKLHQRALEFVDKKEMDKAIKLYEEIILTDPNDDEAYLIMGHCLVLTGQFEKAEEAFQSAGHINPQNLTQVLPFYENLIRQNPDDDGAYANLGFVCLMFGNIARAADLFERALSLNFENQIALRGIQLIESQGRQ